MKPMKLMCNRRDRPSAWWPSPRILGPMNTIDEIWSTKSDWPAESQSAAVFMYFKLQSKWAIKVGSTFALETVVILALA